jgi:hypothetical protein
MKYGEFLDGIPHIKLWESVQKVILEVKTNEND